MTAKDLALWLKVFVVMVVGSVVALFLAVGLIGLAVIGWRALF